MCHETTGATYDRPLFREDVPLIAKHFPNLDPVGIEAVYQAITDHHWPQPAVLVTVLEMVDRLQRGDVGFYRYPTMPFSAMDIETFERVQSDSMRSFHTVFESMALAQRNMKLLQDALEKHFGAWLILFCDCGCSMLPAGEQAFDARWYQEINQLRSLAEAAGTRIVRVTDFTDPEWTSRVLDMSSAETASYERMFSILQVLPHRSFDVRKLASAGFKELFTTSA